MIGTGPMNITAPPLTFPIFQPVPIDMIIMPTKISTKAQKSNRLATGKSEGLCSEADSNLELQSTHNH